MRCDVVEAVLFDVNETLFPLDPIRDRMRGLGLPGDALETWFAAILIDGIGAAATGTYAAFPDLARFHAARLLDQHGLPHDRDEQDEVIGGFQDVVPHPDVEPMLRELHAAGTTLCTLTNGTAEVTRSFLRRAGLDDLVDHVWDVTEAGLWKPRPEPYRWAVRQLGLPADRVALVAAHPWDVHGAVTAGLVGAWVERTGSRPWPPPLHEPHVTGGSLTEVGRALLDRGAAATTDR